MTPSIARLLLLLMLASPTFGQDGDSAPEADVEDTSVAEIDGSANDEQDRAAEIDALEPGVPSQVLAADVRRVPSASGVMDELDLGATEVTGNQELPKVLYIVPWQKSDPGDLMGRPANTLLEEVLAPVDRREFTREVDYYSDLFEEPNE